jgi:hypothetical protein
VSQRALRALLAVAVAAVAALLLLPAPGPAAPTSTPASYPDCGTYRGHPGRVTDARRRINACIVAAAREGKHARAVTVLATVDSGPIPTYYFVRGERDVLVVIDTRRWPHGPRRWLRLQCTRLYVVSGLLRCTVSNQLGTGKPPWLTPVRLSG